MGDKAKAPRIKEQFKDYPVEAVRNEPAKHDLKNRQAQEKAVEVREQKESHECE